MIERVLNRFISLILSVMMALSLMPALSMPVYAATVNTGVDELTADSNGSATWIYSNGTITGSVNASSSSGCTGTTYTAQTGTLTFKNNLNSDAILTFEYELTFNGGSATVDGTAVTAGDKFSKKLPAGGTVAVAITSNASNETATTITIRDLSLEIPQDYTTTFLPAENGSYTVDGTAITAETELTKNSSEAYALVATADSGYKFAGWYSSTDNTYLSYDANASVMINKERTVTAVFVDNSTAIFEVSGTLFTDLNDAVDYAVTNAKPVIVLKSDGTLPAGDYTIPAGKTLLIPFDAANTVYTTAPEVVYGSHANPSAFRTLTMESGASITVASEGSISVPSKLSATGTGSGSWNGTPTGKHGRIHMNGGSTITVEDGGNLYAYGYISGDGHVIAGSGSTVYECFQIRCWRGGTATSGMADNSQKVFPLNQYYVQNIEAPLTLEAGATERVYTAVNMSSQAFAADATFIGNGGMFTPSGSVTKWYDGAADRLMLDVDGDFEITPMFLRIAGLPLIGTLDLNTSDYVLPINSNISINVNSGTTTVNQDVAFLPGSELTVASDASATLARGKKAYVYDKDQWGAYAVSDSQLVPVGYSTVNGTKAIRSAGSLTDARLDINGAFNLAGSLYTTESGAAIVSSEGTGTVVFTNAAGTETTTYQATQSGSSMTYVSIPITSAILLNGDGTYTDTAYTTAGTTYYFCRTCKPEGIWETKHSTNAYKLTLKANIPEKSTTELSEEDAVKEITIEADKLDEFEFPAETFACSGYTLTGWSNGENDPIPAANIAEAVKDLFNEEATEITLSASWTPNEITVSYEGEGAETQSIQCEYGSTITLKTAEDFVRENYVLTGWTIGENEYEPGASYEVVGDFENNKVSVVAKWEAKKYTITWMNGEEEITTSQVAYGETPVYEGEAPVKAADDQYTYTFTGWTPEITAVTGDATYTAVFSTTVNKYAITFVDESGKVLQTGEVEYGQMPEYTGETPVKEPTAQFTYTFDGWTPELAAVTGEETYVAKFKEETRNYTVIWLSEDGQTEFGRKDVPYGETPVYEGEIPTKENENPAKYTYTFAGWYKNDAEEPITVFDPVDGDVTYKAAFAETINKYTVTFKNDDDTVLESKEWEYGTVPSYDTTGLVKESTAEYTYTFAGWTPEVAEVTKDAEYKATYSAVKNTYTVTWNIDGVKTEETYEYGQMPSHSDPEKEDTAEYSYSFSGWQPSLCEVTGNAEYTAVFNAAKRSYTVTWQNDDGTELLAEQVEYGTIPVYTGRIPTKTGDEQYTYTFAGWTPNIAEVTGDVTYTATFTTETNSYEVKWVDYDGTELKTETLEYGEMPTAPADPAREATAQYTYTFAGWTPAVGSVTKAVTYTAAYNETIRSYAIRFADEDGNVLDEQTLAYGETPEYAGVTPTKAGNAQYSYAFKGWDPAITEVTGEQTYTAQFEETVNTYKVTWKDEDGTVLETDPAVPYGTMPAYDSTEPTKESTSQYDYTFAGWDPEVAEVTGDVVYTAQYTETLKEYTVAWVNDVLDEDGKNIVLEKDEKVKYGEKPVYDGETPAKPPTEQYEYTFDKWVKFDDPTVILTDEDKVTGNITYLATYTASLRTYTVTWINDDGTVLETDENVAYGSTPAYDGETPVKASTDSEEYTFTGWTPEISAVSGDVTYKAQYESAARKYKVTWKNGNEVVAESTVGYNEHPVVPEEIASPEKNETITHSYTFTGWEDESGNKLTDETLATGDMTFSAAFEEVPKTGWVRWTDDGIYYVDNGILATGICRLAYPEDESLGYKEPVWDDAVDSGHPEDGKGTFVFDEDGKLHAGVNGIYAFVTSAENAQYDTEWLASDATVWTVNGEIIWHPGLVSTDGVFYYFKTGNVMVKDCDYAITKTNDLSYTDDERTVSFRTGGKYSFDPDGVLLILNGFVDSGDKTYYYVDSIKTYAGLLKIGDDFYYVKSDCTVIKGRSYYVGKTNGLMAAGTYTFDEEGKMVIETVNGIARDDDGLLHYYVDGAVQKNMGLIELDGKYYYVNGSGEVISGRDYAITKTNGLSFTKENGETASFQSGKNYTFDEDGVLQLYDGLVEIGADKYYYVDGVKTYAGLIKLDDAYYYITSSCKAVVGRRYYVSKNNDLKPVGTYEFDADGKMIIENEEPDMKEGIMRDDSGVLRYYVKDEIQKNLGLIELDGRYYYVNGSGEVVNGKDYSITKTNGLKYQGETEFVSGGKYTFDSDGALCWYDGITEIDGVKYYFVNGVKTYAGLVQIDGTYYYVNSSCKLVVGSSYYVSKTNGLLNAGTYTFDEDGKMIV